MLVIVMLVSGRELPPPETACARPWLRRLSARGVRPLAVRTRLALRWRRAAAAAGGLCRVPTGQPCSTAAAPTRLDSLHAGLAGAAGSCCCCFQSALCVSPAPPNRRARAGLWGVAARAPVAGDCTQRSGEPNGLQTAPEDGIGHHALLLLLLVVLCPLASGRRCPEGAPSLHCFGRFAHGAGGVQSKPCMHPWSRCNSGGAAMAGAISSLHAARPCCTCSRSALSPPCAGCTHSLPCCTQHLKPYISTVITLSAGVINIDNRQTGLGWAGLGWAA